MTAISGRCGKTATAGGRVRLLESRRFQRTERAYIATRPLRKSIKRITEALRIQTGRDMGWLDAGERSTPVFTAPPFSRYA